MKRDARKSALRLRPFAGKALFLVLLSVLEALLSFERDVHDAFETPLTLTPQAFHPHLPPFLSFSQREYIYIYTYKVHTYKALYLSYCKPLYIESTCAQPSLHTQSRIFCCHFYIYTQLIILCINLYVTYILS